MIWQPYENKHWKQTGIVIGNGPSLADVPLDFLRRYPTIGSNRIYTLGATPDERGDLLTGGFTPTYYTAMDTKFLENYTREVKHLGCPHKFIHEQFCQSIPRSIPVHEIYHPEFSESPRIGINTGWTITYANLQLAYFMGFHKVLLVGVDHSTGHFRDDYCDRFEWKFQHAKARQHYKIAQEFYHRHGRYIRNLSPISELDVFPKSKIELWM